ncbi:hypothetical protein GOBAR_AA28746 [Gossypium barbadense]|uniref:Uncharacterized protein n=1 Tax=Gossypium barbadense TaxID=3634 RepID=A0A2P5WLH5_GOSBA|nr:hypothetical protein GOBAR_AA28746 [Gossypium barbadense]
MFRVWTSVKPKSSQPELTSNSHRRWLSARRGKPWSQQHRPLHIAPYSSGRSCVTEAESGSTSPIADAVVFTEQPNESRLYVLSRTAAIRLSTPDQRQPHHLGLHIVCGALYASSDSWSNGQPDIRRATIVSSRRPLAESPATPALFRVVHPVVNRTA